MVMVVNGQVRIRWRLHNMQTARGEVAGLGLARRRIERHNLIPDDDESWWSRDQRTQHPSHFDT